MSEDKVACSSCKTRVANKEGTAMFPCPKCGKEQIVRCSHCREIVAKYTCTCGFVGPN